MMTNRGNASIWVIIGLLVVAAILLFAFSDRVDDDSDTATTTDTDTTTSADAATAEQIQAAVSGNGSIQCAYNLGGDGATSYIKNGKIRTIIGAEDSASNMIYTEDTVYVWEQGASRGIAFNAQTFAKDSNQTKLIARPEDVSEAAGESGVSCSVADVNDQLFTVPENVNFQTFATSSQATSSTEGETGGQLEQQ